MEVKQDSRLPSALRNDGFESCTSSLVDLPRSAFLLDENQANLFVTVGAVIFLQKMVYTRKAYQYSKNRTLDSHDESAFSSRAAARYEQRLGTAFFAERAEEPAHRRREFCQGLIPFAQAPEDVFGLYNTSNLCH